MARGTGKRTGKTSIRAPTTSLSASERPSQPEDNAPPAPFTPAPASLTVLTQTLPTDHVFLLHADTSSPSMRRKIFLVPVLLNITLTVFILWRVYYAAPEYLYQILTIFGYETSWTIDTQAMPSTAIFGAITERTSFLIMDYFIFGIVGRWPYEFLFGNKHGRYIGAAGWKLAVGFSKDKEVVVRRGRNWDMPLFSNEKTRKRLGKPGMRWTQEEELAVHAKCTDALRKSFTCKTAYLLLDKNWDLDFKAMIDANDLIEEEQLDWHSVDHVVLVPFAGKWFTWYPHAATSSAAEVETTTVQDLKLDMFRQRLIEIGCENVFYRWIEIMQYETSRPGEFGNARKTAAADELRKLLRQHGQDDKTFWSNIGGEAGIPGLQDD